MLYHHYCTINISTYYNFCTATTTPYLHCDYSSHNYSTTKYVPPPLHEQLLQVPRTIHAIPPLLQYKAHYSSLYHHYMNKYRYPVLYMLYHHYCTCHYYTLLTQLQLPQYSTSCSMYHHYMNCHYYTLFTPWLAHTTTQVCVPPLHEQLQVPSTLHAIPPQLLYKHKSSILIRGGGALISGT
jgi:hypothetical protein